jgi:predicted Ser/Thr protein kinase
MTNQPDNTEANHPQDMQAPSERETVIREKTSDVGATIDEEVTTKEQEATLAEETQEQLESFDTSRSDEPFANGDAQELTGAFGRYQISRLLGEGAMGSVYLARDSQLNREVALKVPKSSAMFASTSVERFYREARAAAILNHPGICPVYDVGEINGRHYLTMGFIEGRPLDLYVEKNKNQPERRVVGVVRKLALALQEAHDKGIIHRDLKPANIMIDHRNDPVVMDFGLARQTDEQEARLTREGAVMGSPAYMSPEQVKGLPDIGPSTDIYSLGIVLYELLTGSTPFQGTIATVIGKILHTEATAVTERRPDISPELAAICHKAMAKSVDDRYASMKEFSEDLARFLSGKETTVGVSLPEAGETVSAEEAELQRKRAVRLLKSEKYSEAVEVLSTLSGLSGEANTQVAQWATAKLTSAEQKLSDLEEEAKSLVRRAKKCMDNADYERTLQLLDRIPSQLSGHKKLQDMRAEAQELFDEVAQLSVIIQSNDVDQIELFHAAERLLELKPEHRKANELYDRLSQEQANKSQAKRKKKRPAKNRKGTPAYVWLLGLLVVVLAGVVIAQSVLKKDDDPPPTNDPDKNQTSPLHDDRLPHSGENADPPNLDDDDRPFRDRPFRPPSRPGEKEFRPGKRLRDQND